MYRALPPRLLLVKYRESGFKLVVQGMMFEENHPSFLWHLYRSSENCDVHGLFHEALLCIASLLRTVHRSSSAIWLSCTPAPEHSDLLGGVALLHAAFSARFLIIARAASAPATDALDFLILLQLLPRHAADARAVEVGFLGLNAAQAAKLSKDERQQLSSAQFDPSTA